jgi:predicted acyltransferase
LAARVDQWFLNLFPREQPFEFNSGGYLTLSFVPSLATMTFGLLAAGLLRSDRTAGKKLGILLVAGLAGLGLGQALDSLGVCPIVKRIWTPSWTLFSTGWTCLFLATFVLLVDVIRLKPLFFPCIVVGMNSIAMYVLAHTVAGYIERSIKIHLGQDVFKSLGEVWEPAVESGVVLFVMWLIVLWMHRRRIFLRI